LIRELQHRSNNLLAVIQTIARGSLSGSQSLSEAKERFEARLHALARAHRRVTDSDWSGIELRDIILAELAPFAARARFDGPKIKLGPRRAQDFSLAVHELVTNAVKCGALSSPAGEVNASWLVEATSDGRVLNFRWRERGGPVVVAPSRNGFGTRLLNSILNRAQFDYAAEGLSCDVDLPLSEFEDPREGRGN
jgi:two-component sensor histidine kinase